MSAEAPNGLDSSFNQLRIPTEKVKEMRQNGIVRNGSPYWWDTDYAPDPREFMPFDTFVQRLTPVEDTGVRIYTEEKVPMTVLPLSIDGDMYPFMVTARPWHANSVNLVEYDAMEKFAEEPPIIFRSDENAPVAVLMEDHFQPHIHGLFVGTRQNHLFWYPVQDVDFIEKTFYALQDRGLGFIAPWINHVGTRFDTYREKYGEKTYERAHRELAEKNVIGGRRPIFPDFPYEWVTAEEFVSQPERSDLMLHYPLRLPGIRETLPLAISTQSHQKSRVRKPVVLGIATGQMDSFRRNDGVWRI